MNNRQLEHIVRSDHCLNDVTRGVFAINTLPKYVTGYPSAYIVNTAPLPGPGKHWIAIIFFNGRHAEFLDSLGKSPEHYGLKSFILRNSNHCSWINNRIQASDSSLCGLYVLYFITMRLCFDISLDNMCSDFSQNFVENDELVAAFIQSLYS